MQKIVIEDICLEDALKFEGEFKKQLLRQLRKPLLMAFDVYKSNVNYGVILETEEEKTAVIKWYNKLLDLSSTAFKKVPNSIKKYL